MEHCKLQACCLIIILYIVTVYAGELKRTKRCHRLSFFDGLLAVSILCVIFDGITAYTVNHPDSVNKTLNLLFHMIFLLGLDSVIFLLFLYMLSNTGGLPKKQSAKILLYIPYTLNILILLSSIGSLEYRSGSITSYSMGIPVYACFIMAGVYLVMTMAVFFRRRNHIESRKRAGIFTYQSVLAAAVIFQMLVPESLISSIAVTILIMGVYMNIENPAIKELERYHDEMIQGFATLMENKDGSTGGHIRRTAGYARLLAEELAARGFFTDILTKDYIENLYKAAPLHDIGKISVPDSILQKPGRLTEDEFEIMKLHTVDGGRIIQDTFWHLGSDDYNTIAYSVAVCHHEKWNGRGYPNGLKGDEIPLCARIMAVADVFDAVSEKRCYRDAMPLDKCFDIIRNGSGSDFDPAVAEVFLDIRPKVTKIYCPE